MKVSIVFSGRNPNHAGNLITRIKRAFAFNTKEATVEVDWIFVEWNPTKDLISPWLASKGVRCYIIPESVHNSLVDSKLIGRYTFMDGFANNIGARRAKHEWVLITNNDAIIGRKTWQFLLSGELNPKIMYRAERRDIPIQYFGMDYNIMEREAIKVYPLENKLCYAIGSFMLVSMQNYPGYDERIRDTNRHADGHLCWNWMKNLNYGMEIIDSVYKADHRLMLYKQSKKLFIPEKGLKHSDSGIIRKEPYYNTPDWGLPEYREKEIKTNMWRLKK